VKPGAVVVAGGTGALGQALVQLLAAEGRPVAVPYRSRARFDAVRGAHGERVWGAAADIDTVAGAKSFFAEAAKALGAIDGVAIVAGAYAGSGPLADAPDTEWPSMMKANLETAHAVCRAAIPHLAPGGSVVTVASRLVEAGGAGSAAYVVAKAGVAALTRVLALEYRGRLRFNCVAPGTIDTPDNRKAMPDADRGQWTAPESIARVISFLLSPESAPVTGAYLPVDGR
jgi:NAD(P)-dependent dehydrogenase (short-subunit alcohol dehydrogenase family)